MKSCNTEIRREKFCSCKQSSVLSLKFLVCDKLLVSIRDKLDVKNPFDLFNQLNQCPINRPMSK